MVETVQISLCRKVALMNQTAGGKICSLPVCLNTSPRSQASSQAVRGDSWNSILCNPESATSIRFWMYEFNNTSYIIQSSYDVLSFLLLSYERTCHIRNTWLSKQIDLCPFPGLVRIAALAFEFKCSVVDLNLYKLHICKDTKTVS